MKSFKWFAETRGPSGRGNGDIFGAESLVLLGSVGTDGTVRFLNQAWERYLADSPKKRPECLLRELIPLERAAADVLVNQLLDPADRDPVEICLRDKNGARRRFLWHRRFDPQEKEMYVVGEEIAEQKPGK
jgi:hypothetical protein